MPKYEFESYVREQEPDKYYKTYIWKTAIGLQQVDGLETSEYLIKTANKNIAGDITVAQARELIDSYYNSRKDINDNRTEEADKVASRISEILSEKSFSMNPNQYLSIHKRLFDGIYDFAGKYRTFNISKSEWILGGDSVTYGGYDELRETLEYDLATEKNFSYAGLNNNEIVAHLARFVSNLWQNHVFGEGNTRATAVFFIKYLRTLGYESLSDTFVDNSWYFRNALVRANYTNIQKNIYGTTEYLELFLKNLIFGEKNALINRQLDINHCRESYKMNDI